MKQFRLGCCESYSWKMHKFSAIFRSQWWCGGVQWTHQLWSRWLWRLWWLRRLPLPILLPQGENISIALWKFFPTILLWPGASAGDPCVPCHLQLWLWGLQPRPAQPLYPPHPPDLHAGRVRHLLIIGNKVFFQSKWYFKFPEFLPQLTLMRLLLPLKTMLTACCALSGRRVWPVWRTMSPRPGTGRTRWTLLRLRRDWMLTTPHTLPRSPNKLWSSDL